MTFFGAVPRRLLPWLFVGPHVLLLGGFLFSRSTDTLWLVLIAIVVGVFAVWSLRLLCTVAGTHDWKYLPAAALALVCSGSVLVEFGALLLARLVIVPDPTDPFGTGMLGEHLSAGWDTLGKPVAGLGLVFACCELVLARKPGNRLDRLVDMVRRNAVQIGPADRRWYQDMAVWGLAAAAVVCVLLPCLGPSNGTARLTFLGIAFAEYGKIFFLFSLARVAAIESGKYAEGQMALMTVLRVIRGLRPSELSWQVVTVTVRELGFKLFPMGLFLAVAAASALRQDFGTLIPAFAGMIGVTWAVTAHNTRRDSATVRATVAAYGSFLRAFAVMVVFAVLAAGLFPGYIKERTDVWADPWAYRWDAGCVVVEGSSLPVAPTGTVACQRSRVADTESERSQVSHALAAIADGGLWGRGLRDTKSGYLPAGSTDFVLAVVWNKLGGLVVLSLVALLVLLGAALARLFHPPGSGWRPSLGSLAASGLSAMVTGQCLFVYAATAGLIPHSGIPVPLISRGGQSTLVILATLVVLCCVAATSGNLRQTAAAEAAAAQPAARTGATNASATMTAPVAARRGSWRGALAPVAVFAMITMLTTVVAYPAPLSRHGLFTAYDEHRTACAARTATRENLISQAPDPATCSTDRIAFARTGIEISFAGVPGLRQNRGTGQWELIGDPKLDGMALSDLTGLVRTGDTIGLLERTYGPIVNGTAGADLSRRISPAHGRSADGGLALTLDPGLQHRVAVGLTSDDDQGAGPLAGGVVVMDAATGRVLAAASAPTTQAQQPTATATVDSRADAEFSRQHKSYANLADDPTKLEDGKADSDCDRQGIDPKHQVKCWKWSYTQPSAKVAAPADDPGLLRYVGNDSKVKRPSPTVNRALGNEYGLGSTFKVVIAAAYLDRPGTSADDLIAAPETLSLSSRVAIHNTGGGQCPGTVAGKISLTRALAVSCNTAFVGLARQLGWSAIAEQAGRFGFRVGACRDVDEWLSGPQLDAHGATALVGSADSCVPSTVDGVSIGNNALGGQDVRGTPLAVASMMATVANGGNAIRPTLVGSAVRPETGRVIRPAAPVQTRALGESADTQLRTALSQTAVDGTAGGLRDAVGAGSLWLKTGTFELVPQSQPLPSGTFVRDDSWMAGFVDTPTGPVSFAVVVEAPDQLAGSQRARHLVQTICRALGVRG